MLSSEQLKLLQEVSHNQELSRWYSDLRQDPENPMSVPEALDEILRSRK
jgi:hypothetical protein